ncbi:response regulator [Paraburkholderia sp. 32]|uniref:response regulator n=1 Tax=Paraburkholderia sp. 32 TaxID=2991057 RepID=UPI003D1F11CF
MTTRLLVSVVDDDESVREALPDLVRELGFDSRAFASAEAFLDSDSLVQTDCLILDLMMPGMGGHGLAIKLKEQGFQIPIIFITANRTEAARAQIAGSGGIARLYKPFSDAELSDALVLAAKGCRKV